MSRFFAGKDSDTETESELSDEEHVQPVAKSKAYQGDFSDDDEETKRVVRTAKDKRFEEIQNVIKNVKNSKKIKDVGKVLEEFDQLTRAFTKSQKVIEKEGVPVFYVRTLVDLEDFVNQSWAEKATLSKLNTKALGSLRSKFRKYAKDFEGQMASFRLNPVASEEENVQGEDEDDDDDDTTDYEGDMTTKKSKGPKAKKAADDMDDDDDEDMDWDTDTDTSETDSEDEERYKNDPAARFLKRPGDEEKQREKDKQKKKTVGNRPGHMRQRRAEVDEEGWTTMTDKPKLFSKDAEINHSVVLKKLSEIISQRGKKSTDRQEQIELIEELRVVARRAGLGDAIELKLMLSLISSIFDYNPNMATNMKPELWRRLIDTIGELVKFLNEHTEIEVVEEITDEEENVSDTSTPYRVHGLPLALIERMDDEFTRILQNTDAHSPDYVENLKNEPKVVIIIERMQSYMEAKNANSDDMCRIYERRIAHIYYKIDYKFMDASKKGVASQAVAGSSVELLDKLCAYIYNHDMTDRTRLRAILMRVYHSALHDQWYEARDLMLMSKAQENISHADPPTQVLYNRAMVQLGISAFRAGNINEAHNALMDIQSSGRPKELLAQGLLPVRQHERSPEQEKIEKRRQMPFHMHINLDVLECVYLVSAMFIEVPYLAAHENDQRRRIISKYFYHSMKQSERHALSGPPETLPEYVIAASKAMKTGDWKKCKDFILSEKLNKRVWNFFYDAEKIRTMLGARVQESSLRCFMFSNSAFYDAISVKTLSEMFDLSNEEILSLIGKMIATEDLAASVDEPSQTVIMHRTEPSRVQQLALQLADKLSQFVETNEKLLDMKTPNNQRGNKNWVDRRQHQGQGYQDRQHGGDRQHHNYQDRQHGYQDRGHNNYQNRQHNNYQDRQHNQYNNYNEVREVSGY